MGHFTKPCEIYASDVKLEAKCCAKPTEVLYTLTWVVHPKQLERQHSDSMKAENQ
jgi:hypothetical protein